MSYACNLNLFAQESHRQLVLPHIGPPIVGRSPNIIDLAVRCIRPSLGEDDLAKTLEGCCAIARGVLEVVKANREGTLQYRTREGSIVCKGQPVQEEDPFYVQAIKEGKFVNLSGLEIPQHVIRTELTYISARIKELVNRVDLQMGRRGLAVCTSTYELVLLANEMQASADTFPKV